MNVGDLKKFLKDIPDDLIIGDYDRNCFNLIEQTHFPEIKKCGVFLKEFSGSDDRGWKTVKYLKFYEVDIPSDENYSTSDDCELRWSN